MRKVFRIKKSFLKYLTIWRGKRKDCEGVKKISDSLKGSFAPVICLLIMLSLLLLQMLGGSRVDIGKTQLEKRISQALSLNEGVESVNVIIRTVKLNRQSAGLSAYIQAEEVPCGAVAIVKGDNDPLMKIQLTNALCALLGLQASQVEVISVN